YTLLMIKLEPYENELNALTHSGRLRERKTLNSSLLDFASNDYLGLANKKGLLDITYERMLTLDSHAPKSSMLVNGYSEIHQNFEKYLCEVNGFEDGIIVGSGFLANISLIESLVRKGDTLFIDEDFHASGNLASHLVRGKVKVFKHNDVKDLRELLSVKEEGRAIIAIEGVYSMGGDLCEKEIFDLADEFGALLIVDEAHSSGVLGENLLGVFEHFNIEVKANHIKMGTLGKAYGSYGAYILATEHIIKYLINRAKPIIYSNGAINFLTTSYSASLVAAKPSYFLSMALITFK
ncbi:MAG: pyridoxal phosphate-dependent aminotransferase family protein, partial [Woeseiaceae bacterium]